MDGSADHTATDDTDDDTANDGASGLPDGTGRLQAANPTDTGNLQLAGRPVPWRHRTSDTAPARYGAADADGGTATGTATSSGVHGARPGSGHSSHITLRGA